MKTYFDNYDEKTEIIYSFAAIDDQYGWFYCCFASLERLTPDAQKAMMKELTTLIDLKGSAGLEDWSVAMQHRGFRVVPSQAVILGEAGRVLPLECVGPGA
jgi:hypothetical protein